MEKTKQSKTRKRPGPKPSDEKKRKTSVALNEDLYERTRQYAGTHMTTMRGTIEMALSDYLEKQGA